MPQAVNTFLNMHSFNSINHFLVSQNKAQKLSRLIEYEQQIKQSSFKSNNIIHQQYYSILP